MKSKYRRYKIGELIKVSERDYTAGNDAMNRADRTTNTYRVSRDHPLFIIGERKAKNGNAIIHVTISKWDLEHSVQDGVVIL